MILLLCVFLLMGAEDSGQRIKNYQNEIKKTEKELEKVKRSILDGKKATESLRRKENIMKGELEDLQRKIDEIQQVITGLKEEKEQEKQGVAAIQGEISLLSGKMESLKACLAQGLKIWQEQFFRNSIFYSSETEVSLFFSRTVLAEGSLFLSDLKAGRSRKEEALQSKKAAVEEKEFYLRQTEAEKNKQRQTRHKKEKDLEVVSIRKSQQEGKLKELTEDQERMEGLFDKLISAKHKAEWEAGRRKEIKEKKGTLPWPVEGRVVSKYGRYKDPAYQTYFTNRGIRIQGAPSSDVKCAAKGKVVFAQPFQSYGKTVIIEHGGGYFTVYSELQEIKTVLGREILGEETVGMAGETPLYFELREEGVPVDPLLWLIKK